MKEEGSAISAFPTARHLCSWARLTPRVTESAGNRKGKNATGRGNPYIGAALGEAAAGAAARTRTFLAAKNQRLCRHMPKSKAHVAIVRAQLAVTHALLPDPEAEYRDLGPGHYERQADARRLAHGHIRERLVELPSPRSRN